MKITVKSTLGSLIFEGNFNSLAEALLEHRADLSRADLSRANLYGANLCGANLSGADFFKADLSGADFFKADLSGADLSRADLYGANLCGADLYGANLCGANLCGADFSKADLSGVKNAEFIIASTRILPDGDIIGWKKCKDNVLVKLLIPSDAKRSHAFGRNCRAEFAKVLEIFGAKEAVSNYDPNFIYRVGKIVKPLNDFNENYIEECSGGVHFFITRLEAERY